MSNEFDERQEVIEKKEGYYWSVQVQLGKASERVKAKAGGNLEQTRDLFNQLNIAIGHLESKVKEAHDKLTEEEE